MAPLKDEERNHCISETDLPQKRKNWPSLNSKGYKKVVFLCTKTTREYLKMHSIAFSVSYLKLLVIANCDPEDRLKSFLL